MIFQVNGYNVEPQYFETAEEAADFLAQKRIDVLAYEAVRFSICATFVNGTDTTWREVVETDPEDTLCQVFNHTTGQYTEYQNKSSAHAANEQLKNDFLASVGLDKVIELEEIPKPLVQPVTEGTQTL